MAEENQHSGSYSVGDIRRYLAGSMDAAEMHAIERAALRDPFLADAIEGISVAAKEDEKSFAADAAELANRLKERTGEHARVIQLPEFGWKAAVMIVVIGCGLVFTLNLPAPKHELAVVESRENIRTKKSEPNASAAEAASAAKDSMGASFPAQKPQVLAGRQATTHHDAKAEKTRPEQEAPSAARHQKDASVGSGIVEQPAQAFASPTVAPLRGRVTDNRGNPVPGASIVYDNKQASVTDTEGYFSVPPHAGDSPTKVIINSIGYEPAVLSLSDRDTAANIARLSPSNIAMSEVVVTGYGQQKRQRSERGKTIKTANASAPRVSPIGGWHAFEEYMFTKRKWAVKSGTGTQVISFATDSAGRPVAAKIERSLSARDDAESLRLLREGPAWTILKGKPRRAMLTLKF